MSIQKRYDLTELLEILGWTHHRLLTEANLTARRMFIDEAKELYPDDKKEREKYVNAMMEPGKRASGKYNTRILTRATLHNIIHHKHMASIDKAILVKDAINRGLKKKGWLVELDYEYMGIDIYVR